MDHLCTSFNKLHIFASQWVSKACWEWTLAFVLNYSGWENGEKLVSILAPFLFSQACEDTKIEASEQTDADDGTRRKEADEMISHAEAVFEFWWFWLQILLSSLPPFSKMSACALFNSSKQSRI